MSNDGVTVRRTALANFLRTRRAQVTPAEAGLEPGGGLRRTPGLRREELALLSGVGITWYTWLEQGRDINPSPEVLGAIARTLRLNEASRDYLFRLAGQEPRTAGSGQAGGATVPESLVRLVHAQDPAPAVLTDARWDLLAWNAAAEALYGYSDSSAQDRNLAWLTFAAPAIRDRTRDWPDHARRVIGEIRDGFARDPAEGGLEKLMARLRADFPDAARWLDERQVSRRSGNVTKALDHPVAGALRFTQLVLAPAGAPGLQIVVMQPEPGTGTAERMAGLAGQDGAVG